MNYHRPQRDDICVALAFYSPVGWRTPIMHFLNVRKGLGASQIPTFCIELVQPGVKAVTRTTKHICETHVIESESVLFHKENLFNILEQRIPEQFKKIIFLDADISLSRLDWVDRTSDVLDRVSCCQPFDWAEWLDKSGQRIESGIACGKFAAAVALAKGETPRVDRYHPGFAWAWNREAFRRCKGFYDRHPVGGGDLAAAFALWPHDKTMPITKWIRNDAAFASTKSFTRYRANVHAQQITVGYLGDNTATHHAHGSKADRRYCDRGTFLPQMVDGEYPLHHRADGLLEWDDISANERMFEFFRGRNEDS